MLITPKSLDYKYAKISASSSGDNTIVAAVTNYKIRPVQIMLISAGTVNVTFQDGAGGTALTGAIPLIANVGFNSGYCPVAHMETSFSALLNISLSGAVLVAGWIVYVLEGGNNS